MSEARPNSGRRVPLGSIGLVAVAGAAGVVAGGTTPGDASSYGQLCVDVGSHSFLLTSIIGDGFTAEASSSHRGGACPYPGSTVTGANTLRAKNLVAKYTGGNDAFCAADSYVYNPDSTSGVTNPLVWTGCGTGNYQNYDFGGHWHGSWTDAVVQSGYKYYF